MFFLFLLVGAATLSIATLSIRTFTQQSIKNDALDNLDKWQTEQCHSDLRQYTLSVVLSINSAECHVYYRYAESLCSECRYDECRGACV
jgi:hypothetical protein